MGLQVVGPFLEDRTTLRFAQLARSAVSCHPITDNLMQQITDGLQFPEGPVVMADGSIVLVEIRRGTLTRVLPDGRHEIVAHLGGGPNGAAVGPDGAMYVCNNGGAW